MSQETEDNTNISKGTPEHFDEDQRIAIVQETCPSVSSTYELDVETKTVTVEGNNSNNIDCSNRSIRKLRDRDPTVRYSERTTRKKKNVPTSNRKNLQNMGKNRFVANLNNEFDVEDEGLCNKRLKNDIILHFNACVNKITDSHHEILDAFMEKRDMEDAFETKYSERITKLEKESEAISEYNTRLLEKNKILHEDLKGAVRSANADGNRRIKEVESKKNLELSKLRLSVQSLKSDLVAAKHNDAATELKKEKSSHKNTKDMLNAKIKSKDDLISVLKKDKADLVTKNKDLEKKVDNVEKDF